LHAYLQGQSYTWEIIVVSNGSTDDTEGVVRRATERVPNLKLLTLRQRGKGVASKHGALRSRGEIIFLCDADLSMPPESIADFLTEIEHVDVVVGSREAPGARRFDEPWHRHLMGRVFNLLVQWLAVPGIRDTQCGFKAFRRKPARDLFGRQTLIGFGFDVELLFLARRRGYTMKELPIDWYFDADTRVRPGADSLRMVAEVLHMRMGDALGHYQAREAAPGIRREDIA
jgi:dolichyl-phosphate beta-glucosyltransferase